jgi:tetratricopeptide (TPR) repeat protein
LTAAGIVLLSLVLSAWLATRFDLLGQAGMAYQRHDYRVALQVPLDHLRWFPNDRRASLMAARCLSRLGQPLVAEPHYQRAEPIELEDMQVRAYGLFNAGDAEHSATIYEQLLVRWPGEALALKRLAAVRMGQKQWHAVLDLAEGLIGTSTEEAAGWTLAGIAHHELKHYAQAVDAGRRVLALDPNLKRMPLPRTLFWNNLALDLMAMGQTAEARHYLEQALAGLEDAGLMELLGLTYSQEGASDQAERCWLQAERWDPDNADVCLDLGRLALSRRRWDEAAGYLKRAAQRSPNAIEPLYNLSQAYRMLGQVEQAERTRRLADQRRRSLPPRSGMMGPDIAPARRPARPATAQPESRR